MEKKKYVYNITSSGIKDLDDFVVADDAVQAIETYIKWYKEKQHCEVKPSDILTVQRIGNNLDINHE